LKLITTTSFSLSLNSGVTAVPRKSNVNSEYGLSKRSCEKSPFESPISFRIEVRCKHRLEVL
jgi:hypothetical protein